MNMIRTLLYVLPKLLTCHVYHFNILFQDLVNIWLFRFADLVLWQTTAVCIQSFQKFIFQMNVFCWTKTMIKWTKYSAEDDGTVSKILRLTKNIFIFCFNPFSACGLLAGVWPMNTNNSFLPTNIRKMSNPNMEYKKVSIFGHHACRSFFFFSFSTNLVF